MPNKLSQVTRWATRVHTDASTSLARDLKALSVNVAQCKACQSRWFALSCRAEALNRFMAPRFVTTLVIVVALIVTAVLI